MPVEQFGSEVPEVIRAVPELSQLDLDGRLLMPSGLRHHLLNALLQELPPEQLSEPFSGAAVIARYGALMDTLECELQLRDLVIDILGTQRFDVWL
jgi:hypothetical protein